MSGFDLIIAAIFLVSMLVGVFRGFIKESLSIISWLVAIWLAFTFDIQAGDFLGQYINIPNLTFRTWAGFAFIFIITLFLFSFLSFVISKLLLHGPIKGTDRVLGIGFGALRAAAIVVALIVVARGLGREESEWWLNSTLLPKFLPMANYVDSMITEDLKLEGQKGDTLQDRLIKQQVEKLQTASPEKT